MREVAADEFAALEAEGYRLQPAAKLWELPEWVDAGIAKSLEQLVSAEIEAVEKDQKNIDAGFNAKPLEYPSKAIKDLVASFKRKTDKIVREYGRRERRESLQREQLAWRLYLRAHEGLLIQYDDVFDAFHYGYGDYFGLAIGAQAVKEMLVAFDLQGTKKELEKAIEKSGGTKQTYYMKRLKVINNFIQSNTAPAAMVLDVLPVLPPEIRPMVQLDGGRFATSDLNDLYRRVINRNNRLQKFLELETVPRTIINNEMRMLQEAVDALFDNGRRGRAVTGTGNRALKSLSDLLKGKQGRFRQNLLGKRVDYSGRSVIVVGPQLKLHQCGLPKLMALELFKPFVMKRLEDLGYAQNIKGAKRMVERSRPQVWAVLEEVIRERPVLLNRAPTLHRLGIQAFEPVLVEGKAIQLHPLVCTAFNADFDGDQMAVHVPLSLEAQAEARVLMLASNNILKPSDGRPVATPTQDMIIGLYHMTTEREGAIGEGKAFGSLAEAELAYDAKVIDLQAKIRLRYRGEIRETTLGRALFNEALPENYRYIEEQVGKKKIGDIVTELVDSHSRTEVAQTLDRIKDAGFYWATRSGVSMSIADANFDASGKFDKRRGEMIVDAEKLHTAAQLKFEQGLTTDLDRRDALGALWLKTTNEIEAELKEAIPAGNAIKTMVESGARGNWLQIRSIIGMRGPVATSSGDFAPMPVKGNYLLGLTPNEYFINATGARKGNADTAMKTATAGYLTRRLVDVAQDVIVREPDCGGSDGIDKDLLNSEEVELSILGRSLAENAAIEKTVVAKAGEIVTRALVEKMKDAGIDSVKVRTVLTCRSERGVCAACYGTSMATNEPVEIGEAIGIIAAQSIGEPGTQLTMRTFHTGGAASTAVKQTILKSIGGKKVRVERLISYDITQGLNGVIDILEARVGWRNQGNVASLAFWDGTVRVSPKGALLAAADGVVTAVVAGEKVVVAHAATAKNAKAEATSFFAAAIAKHVGTVKSVSEKEIVVSYKNAGADKEETLKLGVPLDNGAFKPNVEVGATVKAGQVLREKIEGFKKVVAPIDGTVTQINANKLTIRKTTGDTVETFAVDLRGELTLTQFVNVKVGDEVFAGQILADGSIAYTALESVAYEARFKVGESVVRGVPVIAPVDAKAVEIYVVPGSDRESQLAAEATAMRWSFNRSVSKTFKKVAVDAPIQTISISEMDKAPLQVEDGQVVTVGTQLTTGTPISQEILFLQGRRETEAEIVTSIQKNFTSQGVPLHAKHIEVIVRQMLGYVTVTDEGDTHFSRGQVVLAETLRKVSKEALAEGKKPASGRIELLGMSRGALAAESWLSAASFQETTRVLTQAALEGKTDRLYGLKENVIIGKLIPAGTGLKEYRGVSVDATEDAKNEKYPNRIWSTTGTAVEEPINFEPADLNFTSIEDYASTGEAAE
jgi:DNA-directed RNA polymerase beta' subunit